MGIGIFRPKVEEKEDYVTREYQILQKTDWYSLLSKQYIHRVEVNGMYKRKAEKVRPVDLGESDGNKPGGVLDWVAKSKEMDVKSHDEKYPEWLIPKFSDIERGSRLTKERLENLIIGEGLTPQEQDVFVEMLFNHEKVLAFEWAHKGMV